MKKILQSKTSYIALPILVLIIGVLIFWLMVKTRSQIGQHQAIETKAYPVDVVEVKAGKHNIVVEAWGAVKPAVDVTISPQVSGAVIKISPDLVPGGLIKKDHFMLQVDPINYELIVQQKKSELAISKAELQIEFGNQRIAQQEFKIIDQQLTDEEKILVLRKPQLETANANIQVAKVALDNAKLDLKRTKIIAPFDALVLEENVDLGSQVASQSNIARLVGTDYYWVEVVLPLNQLKWIDIRNASQDHNVKLFYPSVWLEGEFRNGQALRILGNLTEMGRMVKLLVQVDDPLALTEQHQGQPEILIGSYLQAKIEGTTLNNVIQLDREWMHNGNQVWLVENNQLHIKQIDVVYGNQNAVITSSLNSGDQVITTNISIVSEGMPVDIFEKNNNIKAAN